MTQVELQKIIDNNGPNLFKITDQRRYFDGRNSGILLPPPKADPDNRIPTPIPRRATMLFKGYMQPGKAQYSGDFYEQALQEIYDDNEGSLIAEDEFQEACKHGLVYELHWVDPQGNPKFYPVPIEQARPIWSNDLKPILLGFVWVREIQRDDKPVTLATFVDASVRQEWESDGKTYRIVEESAHFYGDVPVCVGRILSNGQNLFDHILPLIDSLDKVLSQDYADELERFAQAYMLLANKIDQKSVDAIKEQRIFENLGPNVTQMAAFLERNINGSFFSEAADRFERLAYEGLMIQNPNAEQSAGADTGPAMAWKSWGQELLAASVEPVWIRFLQDRVRIIGNLLINLRRWSDAEALTQVSIKMNRNLPYSLTEAADNIAKLTGFVSDETLLKLLPSDLIGSAKEELDRIKAQRETNAIDIVPEGTNDADETADNSI